MLNGTQSNFCIGSSIQVLFTGFRLLESAVFARVVVVVIAVDATGADNVRV